MRGFSQRERLLVIMTVCAVAASAAFRLIGVPLLERNRALEKRIAVLEAQRDGVVALMGRKEAIAGQFRELFAPSADGGEDESPLLAAFAEIESLAQETGLMVDEIRPQGHGSPSHGEDLISVRLRGTVSAYAAFLYGLGRSASLLRIQKLALVYRRVPGLIDGTVTIAGITMQRR